MQKKVACAWCASNWANTFGVTCGSGPSSMVMDTAPAALAGGGNRLKFGPKS
jgi:hypothetical protein